jgi:hypothetical protein
MHFSPADTIEFLRVILVVAGQSPDSYFKLWN